MGKALNLPYEIAKHQGRVLFNVLPLTSVNILFYSPWGAVILTSQAADYHHSELLLRMLTQFSPLAFQGWTRVNHIKYAQYQNSIRWETLLLPRVTYSGCGLSEMLPELQLLCMHRKAWKWMMYSFLYYWTKHYIFSNKQTFKCSKKQCTRYIQTHRALVLLRHILLVFH